MEYTEDTNKSDGIVLKQDIVGKNKADEGEIITITVNKVQKTVTAIVTVDLSKYVQPQANTPTDPDNFSLSSNSVNY